MSVPPDGHRPARGTLVTADDVRQALRSVVDPEVGLDIVTMGLVYDIEVAGSAVTVRYTLTTAGCPLEGLITHAVRAAAQGVPGVDSVRAELVWDPPWTPDMIAEGAWTR